MAFQGAAHLILDDLGDMAGELAGGQRRMALAALLFEERRDFLGLVVLLAADGDKIDHGHGRIPYWPWPLMRLFAL
jgi:hypothetical protein